MPGLGGLKDPSTTYPAGLLATLIIARADEVLVRGTGPGRPEEGGVMGFDSVVSAGAPWIYQPSAISESRATTMYMAVPHKSTLLHQILLISMKIGLCS
jgi:hypothetical protein